ncbi:MAG: DUF2520 domain-containing protein [Chloroflexi bacterium]|nr:DUF2520 domain-containing protein [Chloroflexota bacterium]
MTRTTVAGLPFGKLRAAPRLAFIGAGTVGTALAVRLAEQGYLVVAAASRSPASALALANRVPGCRTYPSLQEAAAAADLVFITTPDAAIGTVAAQLRWQNGQAVVHCSGSDSLDVLDAARRQGADVGAFHPLQSFASVEQALRNLPRSTLALEASTPGLLETLRAMALALEGTPVVLGAGDKVLYHAAAVIACNYLVTLSKLATDLWGEFGVSRDEALRALLPLIQGTVNNLERVGLPNCLTGPIARGDLGTIEKHLSALTIRAPDLLPAYRELGKQTVPIALAKGRLDQERARQLCALLGAE